MSGSRCWCAIGALALSLNSVSLAPAQSPEFRALWASRFEWPDTNESVCKARIDSIMQDLADAHFNAVFFQVRGQADVFYPSPYETWSPILDETDPGWDPLAYAINAAHSRGLEFHAYINTHTCWMSDPSWAQTPPADPNHIFWKHCNLADPNGHDWLHLTDAGNPTQYADGAYVWFAAGVPDFQAYVRQQVLYVVENYDIDGVHFDRIRTPSTNQTSLDPISWARYTDPRTNPDNLDFRNWSANQITRTVCDLYAAIQAVKPHVKVSAAVFYTSYYSLAQHQASLQWSEAGAMDMLVPMMYFAGGPNSSWDSTLIGWLNNNTGNAHIIAGQNTNQGADSLIEQIELTRLRGAAGNSTFSWSSFWYWDDYRAQVYQQPAPTPAMPWKSNPTTGTIVGHLTAPGGTPVVDAQVHLSGRTYTALSCADGFYSFLQVEPGTYTVTATHPAYARTELGDIHVVAGLATPSDITFSGPAPAGDMDRDGDTDLADLLPFYFCFSGPGDTFAPGHYCTAGDADGDFDVDLADFAAFQDAYADY